MNLSSAEGYSSETAGADRGNAIMEPKHANATRVQKLTEAEVERVFSGDLMSFFTSRLPRSPAGRPRKARIAIRS
jgi:hypothetical protein